MQKKSKLKVWCPWCGKRAKVNTKNPITVSCDDCEAVTEIKSIT